MMMNLMIMMVMMMIVPIIIMMMKIHDELDEYEMQDSKQNRFHHFRIAGTDQN